MAVTAVMLAYNRRDVVRAVLDRLEALPIDEILVVDNGSDGTADMVRERGGRARPVVPGGNVGIAGRNVGAREAAGDYILFLDDDSYPQPGAVEALCRILDTCPDVAVAGGLVRDVRPDGSVALDRELGTFDWWLRAGQTGATPPCGFPAFFFPEGGCLVRRRAFLAVGGFFEPFFFHSTEVELATRLLGAGWDVRYVPEAEFDHLKAPGGRASLEATLRRRVRNQIWYFWLRFPADVAARRLVAYGVFDLLNAVYRGVPRAFPGGVLDAWRERANIRGQRRPVPRRLVRRVELRRGRMHADLLFRRLWELRRGRGAAQRRRAAGSTGPQP